jgi:hypothetical protein
MFTKEKILNMNSDNKYGSGWIKNINNLNDNSLFKLHATNDNSLSGRKYIALPANQILTANDYVKYNIMK